MEVVYITIPLVKTVSLVMLLLGFCLFCVGAAKSPSAAAGWFLLCGFALMGVGLMWGLHGNFFVPFVRFV